MSDSQSSPSTTVELGDSEAWKQRKRMEQILDAREYVLSQRRKAMEASVRKQVPNDLPKRIVREAVESYIIESAQAIQSVIPDDRARDEDLGHEEELAIDVWEEVSLGKLHMNTDTVEFNGVRDYINAPPKFSEQWTEKSTSAVGGVQNVPKQAEFEIPKYVSIECFMQLDRFWFQMGLDINMDEDGEEAEFDYSDLDNIDP